MAEQNLSVVIPYAINFSLVVVILYFAARKPLRKYVYQRHERMSDAFNVAASQFKKAQDRHQAAKSSVNNLGKKESEYFSSGRSAAEAEKKEIIEKAHAEAKRLLLEADRMMAAETDDNTQKIKKEFLEMIVAQTESGLKKDLKSSDHSAIYKRAQNSIEVGV